MTGELTIVLVVMIILASFFLSPVYINAKNESHDKRLENQTIRTDEFSPVKIMLNSHDEENKSLKFYIIKFPSNGRLSGIIPNITYTPNLGYHGIDNLTYRTINGTTESNIATVTIEVNSTFWSYIVIIVILIAIFTGMFFMIRHFYTPKLDDNDNRKRVPDIYYELEKRDAYTKAIEQDFNDSITKTPLDNDAKDILKKEYDRYSDLFKENETLGERRVSFYITLITTIISALGITTVATNLLSKTQIGTSNIFLSIVFFILIGLFLFGFVTHRRIIGRNVTTDNYLVDLDKIRIGIAGIRSPKPVKSRQKPLKSVIFSVGKGGIVETIRVINSLIVGLICSVAWIYFLGLNSFIIVPFAIGMVGSWIDQCLYANMSYLHEEKGRIRVLHKKNQLQEKNNRQDVEKAPNKKKKMAKNNNQRETEASLIICSEDPEGLAKQIAQLDSIADFPLVLMGGKKIVDTYFDTNPRILEKERVALRIREINGDYWIAVKGPSQDGILNVDRSENEHKWSHDSLTKIIHYLKNTTRLEIQTEKANLSHSNTEPITVLQDIGLVIVQRRENFREIRNILGKNSQHPDGSVLAELDIDHVIYHLNSTEVSLYDIEIEETEMGREVRKDGEINNNSLLDTIVDELISTYGSNTFKKWNYGKLALGKGIEKLLKDSILKDMMYKNNNLRREAYDKIEEYIQHGEV
jgi:hypothetical protein